MLLTALLHENVDNIDSSLIKTNLEKIQKIVVDVISGMEKTFQVTHEGVSLLDSLQLLTIDNTLIDLCFDWHPNHVGVK